MLCFFGMFQQTLTFLPLRDIIKKSGKLTERNRNLAENVMNIKERVQRLKSDIPAVFIALNDKETPWYAKLFAAITVGYALSPIDLIPDFIPVLGYLDDIIILPILAALTIRLIPKNIMEKSRRQSENMWTDGKPKRWYYAIPIVFIWLLLIWLIIKWIWF